MRIDFFCSDGSPIGVIPPDAWTRGVGGAELALFGLTKALAAKGHSVIVWNDPREAGEHDGVMYVDRAGFDPAPDSDAFILFRGPAEALHESGAGTKIFWSCDQATHGLYHRDIIPFVDATVCISPYHLRYFQQAYQVDLDRTFVIGLGVNGDYEAEVAKVPGRLIYCSIPDRGLDILAECWPRLLDINPDLSLVVTGDYTLWGSPTPGIHRYRIKFLRQPNVQVLGAIPRAELIQHQLKAEVHAFPCIYPELFCLAVAECATAGAVPVTSSAGAIETTNAWGIQIEGNPTSAPWKKRFVTWITELIANPTSLDTYRRKCMEGSRKFWSWDKIANQWIHLIQDGRIE